MFALAFGLLALQRLALALSEPLDEWRTGLYMVRLLAFLLILGAIVDKNRSAGVPRERSPSAVGRRLTASWAPAWRCAGAALEP